MIYVMRSAAFKKGSTTELETIIKIGYTGEKSKKARESVYLTENPTIQILYQIEGGEEIDEKNLHRYFSHLLVYGREWFRDEEEIIDFFENHKTKESLEEIRDVVPILTRTQREKATLNRRTFRDKSSLVNISIMVISESLDRDTDNEFLKNLEKYFWYKSDCIWTTLRSEFPDDVENIKIELRKVKRELRAKKMNPLQKIYNYLVSEFNKDKDFERRMKLLCDINSQYPNFFTIYANSPVQAIIPMNYQNYINTIGFDKIKALGYYESAIIGYLESQQDFDNSLIYGLFKEGDKYTTKQIKKILGDFYTSNNISKTPKASDLNDYFILKSIKLKVGDKWEHGFEIIALKSS